MCHCRCFCGTPVACLQTAKDSARGVEMRGVSCSGGTRYDHRSVIPVRWSYGWAFGIVLGRKEGEAMCNARHSVATMVGLLSLVAVVFTAALPAGAPAQFMGRTDPPSWHKRARVDVCPCAATPFFASFLEGQRDLVACTNNTPFASFVRLVSANIDLVVLFDFPPQLFCGWQPEGTSTSYIPITAAQFDICKRLIVKAAADQGLACLPEF
jgi:hypothetical protein